METEKPRKKSMGQTQKKTKAEITGRAIIDYLLPRLDLSRIQSLAELLDVEKRTLENWYDKTYDELDKRSARLKALFDAIYQFEKESIPPSAYKILLTETPVGKFGSLLEAIRNEPENSLLDHVIKMFTERYFFAINEQQIKKSLAKNRISESDKEKIRRKHKKSLSR